MAERRDLPLFAHAARTHDALRAARASRRRLCRQSAAVALGCAALAATIALPPLPRLVWNASVSAPIGLYRVEPAARVAAGEMVIARTPTSVRALAASRRYIPANVPLVKRVAGVPGDRVCALDTTITIAGRRVAERRARDTQGRQLPWWRGCRTLTDGMVFLMMAETPDSFDGRYFGPTQRRDVIGKATLLWPR